MTNSKLTELIQLHDKLAVRDCGAGGPWDQEPIAWAMGEISILRAALKKFGRHPTGDMEGVGRCAGFFRAAPFRDDLCDCGLNAALASSPTESTADERPRWLPPEELLAVSNRVNQALRTGLDQLAEPVAGQWDGSPEGVAHTAHGHIPLPSEKSASEPTQGLRLAFEEGICGLKFVAGEGKYPESNGPTDMAYINSLIEADERHRG